jgi:hypothetical protein
MNEKKMGSSSKDPWYVNILASKFAFASNTSDNLCFIPGFASSVVPATSCALDEDGSNPFSPLLIICLS